MSNLMCCKFTVGRNYNSTHDIIDAETRWDEGITKSEAIELLIETIKQDKTIEEFNFSQGKIAGHEASVEAPVETPTEAAPDSGVDSAGTSVTLEPDEYKGDNNYETTPEEQDETTKAMKELFKEDLENGLMSQEEYDFLIKSLDDAAAYGSQTPEPTPSVTVTKIGPGAEVTTGQNPSGIEFGEVQVGSGDYSGLEHYRID